MEAKPKKGLMIGIGLAVVAAALAFVFVLPGRDKGTSPAVGPGRVPVTNEASYANVLRFEGCADIEIESIVAGHSLPL